MRRLRRELGNGTPLSQVTAEQTAAVFTAAWDGAAARTCPRPRAGLRSVTTGAAGPGRGWITADLAALVERRPETRDRTRGIDRRTIQALLDRRDVALRRRRCGGCCTSRRPAPTRCCR